MKTTLVQVSLVWLGTIQKELGAQLEKSGIKLSMDLVEKTALLETAEILGKVV